MGSGKRVSAPDESEDMRIAGLSGPQLQFKLQSFQASNTDFKEHRGTELLAEALDKGKIILSSLAGAIPGVGSFAQELIDFLLRELGGRWKFWKRT